MWNDRFSFRRLFDDDDFDKEFAKVEEMLNKMLRTAKDENIQSLKTSFPYEIDAIASRRSGTNGGGGDSHVTERLVSQMLTDRWIGRS